MGMTMTLDDFKGVMQSPKAVAIGVAAQFVVMPSVALNLPRGQIVFDGELKKPLGHADKLVRRGKCVGTGRCAYTQQAPGREQAQCAATQGLKA
jgi:hypothetical protein